MKTIITEETISDAIFEFMEDDNNIGCKNEARRKHLESIVENAPVLPEYFNGVIFNGDYSGTISNLKKEGYTDREIVDFIDLEMKISQRIMELLKGNK